MVQQLDVYILRTEYGVPLLFGGLLGASRDRPESAVEP